MADIHRTHTKSDQNQFNFYCFGSTGVTYIPKCGSQTLFEASPCLYTEKDTHLVKRFLAFIRYPMDRVESLYLFINQYAGKITQNPIPKWEDFVDWLLSTHDYHTKPQANFLCGDEELYPLSDMNRVMGRLVGVSLPTIHKTKKPKSCFSDYRRDEIENKYHADLELWSSL